jgi:DNA-binding NtrC family response regulator
MSRAERRAVAYAADLLFSSHIQETLAREGFAVEVVEGLEELRQALSRSPAHVVLLDLHAGADAKEVVSLCSEAGRVPVVAFGRHTDAALLRAARDAGCAEVVPRSTFVEEMPRLVARALAASKATP